MNAAALGPEFGGRRRRWLPVLEVADHAAGRHVVRDAGDGALVLLATLQAIADVANLTVASGRRALERPLGRPRRRALADASLGSSLL